MSRLVVATLTNSGPRYRFESIDPALMLTALFVGARKLTGPFDRDADRFSFVC
ncbi:hypothetical protein D9M68_846380 [compost metagenome]